jgi:hypothetical protein
MIHRIGYDTAAVSGMIQGMICSTRYDTLSSSIRYDTLSSSSRYDTRYDTDMISGLIQGHGHHGSCKQGTTDNIPCREKIIC